MKTEDLPSEPLTRAAHHAISFIMPIFWRETERETVWDELAVGLCLHKQKKHTYMAKGCGAK